MTLCRRFDRSWFLVFLAILICPRFASAAQQATAALPLTFEKNVGQAVPAARYVLRSGSIEAQFLANQVRLALPTASTSALNLGIEFVGANPDSEIAGVGSLQGKSNYLIGDDSSRWLRGVPNYEQVAYKNIYHGIDVSFYGNAGSLEHDFRVSPGSDFSRIAFRLNGAKSTEITSSGDLEVQLPDGKVVLRKPIAYQESSSGRTAVYAGYVIASNGTIRFKVGNFDKHRELVIDPVLTFATYISTFAEYASLIATDSGGNSYISGVAGLGFPVSSGAFAGCGSCTTNYVVTYVTKLSADGKSLIYSTVLGGNNYAQPVSMAVDGNGNTLLTGETSATDFPTKPSQPPLANGPAAFFLSLSADGSSLNYGKLLGSTPTALTVDSANNAYIAGETGNGFPTTPGALNQGGGGDYGNFANVFLQKFSPTGTLLYSAVIGDADPQNGGGGPVGASALAVDSSGDVFVAGEAGVLWPISSNAYLKKIAGGEPYATPFVTEVSPNATSLIYSTFLDYAYVVTGLAVLPNGNVFVAGNSAGATYPTTANAFQQNSGNGGAAFLTELNSTGSALVYSTVIGDSSFYLNGLALDPANGNIWLAAQTKSAQFPMVAPLQSIYPESALPYSEPVSLVNQFDPTGQTLQFSTFLGGTVEGFASSVAVDAHHRAHVSGSAGYGMYTTPGAYLAELPPPGNGYADEIYAYVALIDPTVAAPAMCVSPNTGVNFYQVTAGTYIEQQVTITSCGAEPLTITDVSTAAGVFTVPAATNGCVQTLAAGMSCTVSVRYSPTTLENDQSTLTIASNAPIPATLPLSGSGVVPVIAVNNTPSFNYTLVGQTSAPAIVIIRNTGQAPLVLDPTKTTVSGDFSLNGLGSCAGPVSVCGLNVYFSPTASGTRTGTLNIASNDPANPLFPVQLQAVGYAKAPVPQISSLASQLAEAGVAQTNFLVSGFGFMPSSVVQVNGAPLQTTYQDSSTLVATLPASAIPANSYGELAVTVVTPAPGGGRSAPYILTAFQLIPSPAAFLLYEPVSKQLFASTPASAVDNANTVIPMNPATATPGTPIPVGNDPGALAASSDGKYLFVGLNADNTIQRINLSTHAVDRTFALPVDPQFGNTKVSALHVVPGSSTDVVASLSDNNGADGIAYFNDSGLVNWIPGSGATPATELDLENFVIAGNPAVIYGAAQYSTPGFTELSYSSAGVQYDGGICCNPANSSQASFINQIATDGTLLYTSSGLVWDPTGGGSVIQEYSIPSLVPYDLTVLPDLSTGKTYFLNSFGQYSEYQATTLLAFDKTSGAQTGSLSLTSANNFNYSGGSNLVRWGSNGFAFLVSQPANGAGAILLFTSSIANGSNLNTAPINSQLQPSWIAPGSPDFVLTVTGLGFVPASTIEWNGSPRITTFVSSTRLTATIYASDVAATSVAQVSVVNPAQGYSTSGSLPFTVASVAPPAPGASLSPASLAFGSQDVGLSSTAQTTTLSNPSSTDLTDISIAVTGANANSFAETNTCSDTVSAGTSCTVSVVFTPAAEGAQSATLTFTDSAASSPQQVALTGTGATPAPQTGLHFMSVTPCRVADTRNPAGPFGGPELAAGVAREFDIPQSSCGIPANAVAYSLNVTVVPNTILDYLTMWPSGQAQPNVSTLNSDGRVKANAAITPAGVNGGVTVFATNATQVILDIDGYFLPSNNTLALAYYPVTPCRVEDTRQAGLYGGPYLTAGTTREFPIQLSPCNLPENAQAYALNVTAIPHNILHYLTIWPSGQPQPNVSTLNSPTGAVVANAAIVPAGTDGDVSVFAYDDADLVLDINGYFAPPGNGGLSLYTTTPCRALDTRKSKELSAAAPLVVNLQNSGCPAASGTQAYVLNSTVVPSGTLHYLTLWPNGVAQPTVSTLNAEDGAITSNMAIVPTTNGSIDAFADGTTNLILDISSYFAP